MDLTLALVLALFLGLKEYGLLGTSNGFPECSSMSFMLAGQNSNISKSCKTLVIVQLTASL
jgi:hypothetical protein